MKPIALLLSAFCLSASAVAAEHPACEELRKDLRRVDAQARQNSTSYLAERRRKIVEKLRELGCSEGGFR